MKPIVVHEQERQVHIALFPEEDGIISYDIYSVNADDEEVLHSQGRAEIIKAEREPETDLSAIQNRCTADILDPAAFIGKAGAGDVPRKSLPGIKSAFIGEKKCFRTYSFRILFLIRTDNLRFIRASLIRLFRRRRSALCRSFPDKS